MSLLHDIYEWSANLEPWQSDAVRRLFQKQTLDAGDYDDLYALLKSSRGLPDPQNRQPQPLSAADLPAASSHGVPITLVAMKDLDNVNRIVRNQVLKFAPIGLTVVYGDNGSGKSGYSRVLKRACRARDQDENVLPNQFLPANQQGTPEAVFEVEVSGTRKALKWVNDQTAPDALSAISVFDSRCARAYLDEEQDVAYMPYGLDVVEALGNVVLPRLSERLTQEIAGCTVDLAAFQDLAGPTAVGKFIAGLSGATEPTLVESLAAVSDADRQTHLELSKTLREEDPKSKAQSLRRTQQRVTALLNRANAAILAVGDDALRRLQTIDQETESAIAAQQLAASQFQAGESLLPGTGGPEWQVLFDAARRFSVIAYPGEAFPVAGPTARCPLCQQTLADGGTRLQRFDDFIKNDTAKTADRKRAERETAKDKVAKESLSLGLDPALMEELSQQDASIATRLRPFESLLLDRQQALLQSLQTHQWDAVPAITQDPRESLQALNRAIAQRAEALEKAADDAQRQVLQGQFAELDARMKLVSRRQTVLDAVAKLRLEAALKGCQQELRARGRAVSLKSKELTQKAVTQALRDALNREFQYLGVGYLQTKLEPRVSSGKTYHKLTLDLPKAAKLEEVLSEGELRAIAIASFLAELSLSGHQGGAVFDDPVSSLDHFRRVKVAKRLVEEAKQRQVIVFTHDTVFLGELRAVVEDEGVPSAVCHLVWASPDHAGLCVEGLPWDHKRFDERVRMLEQQQQQLQNKWLVYPTEEHRTEMRQAYSSLRSTIERAIQDVVFNDVVERYRDWIKVGKLKGLVVVQQTDCEELTRLHRFASNVTDAHDHSTARNAAVPDPAQFLRDINELKTMIDGIKKRR